VEDNRVVAMITTQSVEELGLEVGQQVTALIKATDVMILVDEGLG
jgi:molybdopterin-binding protein